MIQSERCAFGWVTKSEVEKESGAETEKFPARTYRRRGLDARSRLSYPRSPPPPRISPCRKSRSRSSGRRRLLLLLLGSTDERRCFTARSESRWSSRISLFSPARRSRSRSASRSCSLFRLHKKISLVVNFTLKEKFLLQDQWKAWEHFSKVE